jgi:hypothetical protein
MPKCKLLTAEKTTGGMGSCGTGRATWPYGQVDRFFANGRYFAGEPAWKLRRMRSARRLTPCLASTLET